MSKYKIGDVLVSVGSPRFLYRVNYVNFLGQINGYYVAATGMPDGRGGWGYDEQTVDKSYRHATSLELFLMGCDEEAT